MWAEATELLVLVYAMLPLCFVFDLWVHSAMVWWQHRARTGVGR